MAQGQRLAHEDVTVAEVAEVVQVGAAEAGGFDGDLDIVGSEGGEVPGFLGVSVSFFFSLSFFFFSNIDGKDLGATYETQVPGSVENRGIYFDSHDKEAEG